MSTEFKDSGDVNVVDAAKVNTNTEVKVAVEEKTGEVNGLAEAEASTEEKVALEVRTDEVKQIKADEVSINKTVVEEEDDEEEDEEGDGATPEDTESLIIKMTGIIRLDTLEMEVGNFYNFFTKEMGVAAPLIHIPGPSDLGIFFKMMSLEDRDCAVRKCKLKKGYLWNTWRIHLKVMSLLYSPTNEDITSRPLIPMEEALDMLYPYRNVIYYEQLMKKKSISENILIMVKTKELKNSAKRKDNLITQTMLPVTPIEGYDYNPYISLEEDPETHQVVAGIRVCKGDKTRVVPLKACISVPRDIVILIKNFVKKLPEIGLKAINPVTREGDIVGVGFRMTLTAKCTLVVAVPKLEIRSFTSMTNEKGELLKDEELKKGLEDSYLVVTQKRVDAVKTKMENYFEKFGKLRGIENVYVRFVDLYSVSLEEGPGLKGVHILGSTHSVEMINGITFRLSGTKDHSVKGLRSLIGLLEANTALGPHSNIYLVSDSVIIALYLAKKCGHVTYHYCNKYTKNELQDLAKESGIDNIAFVGEFPKSQGTINLDFKTIVIFWKSHNHSLVEKFVKMGLTNFIFVNYWPAAFPGQNEECRKMYEIVCTKCRIHGMFPVDIAPYGQNFAVAVFFSGLGHNPKHVLGPPPLVFRPKRPMENPIVVKSAAPPAKKNKVNPAPFRPPSNQAGLLPTPPPAKKNKVNAAPFRPPSNQAGLLPSPSRPWGQFPSQPSLMNQVATGLMQNLQAVTQHIRSILPADQKQISYPNPWSPTRWEGGKVNQQGGGVSEGWSTRDPRDGLPTRRMVGFDSEAPTDNFTSWSRDAVLYNNRNRSGGSNTWPRQNF